MSNIKRAPAAQVECANDGGGAIRLISKPEVLDRVGVTYPTLWSWMREGKFPRSRQLGGKAAWVESEIEAWITALPVRRLKGDGERAA
jgi:predicted DNA-binding transcriptional regulator AlpA